MTQNKHLNAICCRPEVADVVSSDNVKTIEGYAVLNFEVAIALFVSEIFKKTFRDGGGGC